ncbi:MAG: hypothetical protein R3F54_10980 [Alphaproteobacteria bacterium]
MPRTRAMGLLALVAFCLMGCQHAVRTGSDRADGRWLVLESVGDSRSVDARGRQSAPLRPGETVPDGHGIVTGRGAVLILAGDGIQLTTGESTSFQLAPPSGADLVLDQGLLRIRLAKAVDREARLKTTHFDINASSATLTLQAAPDGSDLVVEGGSIVLATTHGRHQATLVAGAGAKIDLASSSDLLVRPGAGEAYRVVAPLPPAIPNRGKESASVLPTRDLPHAMKSEAASVAPAPETGAMPSAKRAIRPASYPKEEHRGRNETSSATEPASLEPAPRLAQAIMSPPVDLLPVPQPTPVMATPSVSSLGSERPVRAVEKPPVESSPLPALAPKGTTRTGSAAVEPDEAVWLDPLQLQFDRLTEGLLDDL